MVDLKLLLQRQGVGAASRPGGQQSASGPYLGVVFGELELHQLDCVFVVVIMLCV